MNKPMPHLDHATSWRIEDLFPHLDEFIRSAKIISVRNGNRIWVRVLPGIAFCADHSERIVQPPQTCIRSPLIPEVAWLAFLDWCDDKNKLLEKIDSLKPRPGPIAVADLIGDDYLLDDPEVSSFLTNGDRYSQAKATVLAYLSSALPELNKQIVDALEIEAWTSLAENLLRELGLDAVDTSVADYDALVSTISSQWHYIAPHINTVMAETARTSGPAMLYLIGMYSACAVMHDAQHGHPPKGSHQNWAKAMLDRGQQDPHVRLLRAVSDLGHKKSVVRTAARLGARCVRALAMRAAPHLAFQECIDALQRLGDLGAPIDPILVEDLEAAEPRWRNWPTKVLRLAMSHAMSKRETAHYTRLLVEELPCVANALESKEINPSRLPKDIRWSSLVSQASYLEWPSELPAYYDSGYEVRPLLTSVAMRDEGKAMRNCVMEYDLLCASEIAQVYSIWDPCAAMRVATALIMRDGPELIWKLSQVKGPLNQEVAHLIQEIASRIASYYNLNEGKAAEIDRHGLADKAVARLTRMESGDGGRPWAY